jgi:alkylhydroperoxidase family enzyme
MTLAFQRHTPDTAPEASKPLLADVRGQFGFIPILQGFMAESPELLAAHNALWAAFSQSSLSQHEQQVVFMTAIYENNCHYCMVGHTTMAKMQKLGDDVIASLRNGGAIADPKLEALHRFTTLVVRDRGFVADHDVQGLPRRRLHPPQPARRGARRLDQDPEQLHQPPRGHTARSLHEGQRMDETRAARGLRRTKTMIDLYAFPTPNSIKVPLALEELGALYRYHPINVRAGEQKSPEHLARNPNAKVPVIVDHDGPGGQPITVVESAAILLYLAEKHGRLIPTDPVARVRCFEWLMFQAAGLGPMFGQSGYFLKLAPEPVAGRHRPLPRGGEAQHARPRRSASRKPNGSPATNIRSRTRPPSAGSGAAPSPASTSRRPPTSNAGSPPCPRAPQSPAPWRRSAPRRSGGGRGLARCAGANARAGSGQPPSPRHAARPADVARLRTDQRGDGADARRRRPRARQVER